ncbi:MAG: hypothetical protein ACI85I_001714, partial [Arenicella sp.]
TKENPCASFLEVAQGFLEEFCFLLKGYFPSISERCKINRIA